jgi:hypothetical protein
MRRVPASAEGRQPMREQRVDFDAGNRVLGRRALFHNPDCVDYRFRLERVEYRLQAFHAIEFDAGIGIMRVEKAERRICAQGLTQRHSSLMPLNALLEHLMTQHAVSAEDQDAH